MRKFLEEIRSKSLEDRRSFAFTASAIITGLIFIIWLMTLGVKLDLLSNDEPAEISENEINNNQANVISNFKN
ncbi:hypothetical protein H6775_03525 [Candidatus Nomurabacteria bacterium]|nr:hypothetical protein [Candidatus Nomurabacteria bacterium]